MKKNKIKYLFIFLISFAISISANAQNEWKTTHIESDELLNIEECDQYEYTNSDDNSFIYWSNSDNNFKIISNRRCMLDFKAIVVNSEVHEIIEKVKIGFYNSKGKLIDSDETFMIMDKGTGHKAQYPHSKVGEKVIKYLNLQKGYVRIVAPVFSNDKTFDLKVPCRNN